MKRAFLETLLFLRSLGSRRNQAPGAPESIFVLRNNDIGDLLIITPLFQALKHRFPGTKICAGIGAWNFDALKHNPWVDEVFPVNAPWHNKHSAAHPPNSARGWRDSLRYIYGSSEVDALRKRKFSVGIDVLGSPQGSLLLLRAGIPYRLGVRGYAGGHSSCHRVIEFSPRAHVGRSALRFAEILGARELPPNRPQIYLSEREREQARSLWNEFGGGAPRRRVVLAPGGGFREKCWPLDYFAALARALERAGHSLCVIGGEADKSLGAVISKAAPNAVDWTGKASLRETFAIVAASDLVICNSSMAMHAAAAFERKTIVLLGECYADAGQHASQWGYEGNFLVLGRSSATPRIPTAEEVSRAIEERGWLRP